MIYEVTSLTVTWKEADPFQRGGEEFVGRKSWATESIDVTRESRQALPSLLFQLRPALPWGSSQDSMPRATLCTEGRRRTGRKGYTAYSTSESESVKTTVE